MHHSGVKQSWRAGMFLPAFLGYLVAISAITAILAPTTKALLSQLRAVDNIPLAQVDRIMLDLRKGLAQSWSVSDNILFINQKRWEIKNDHILKDGVPVMANSSIKYQLNSDKSITIRVHVSGHPTRLIWAPTRMQK